MFLIFIGQEIDSKKIDVCKPLKGRQFKDLCIQ